MPRRIIEVLEALPEASRPPIDDVMNAVTMILLEVAYADAHFSNGELEQVGHTLSQQFRLPPQQVDEYLKSAKKRYAHEYDVWSHARILNRTLGEPLRRELLDAAWRVVLADGAVDSEEEYIIYQVAEHLYMGLSEVHASQSRVRSKG
jgi:uncharacterized tellurite resistance protein B-like protein